MTVLAHAAHWYHSVLYLAPVAIVTVVLAWQSWRDRRLGDDPSPAGAAVEPPAPLPAEPATERPAPPPVERRTR